MVKGMSDRLLINIIIKVKFYESLELFIKQNYMQFDGKYYTQTIGLARGSPLSLLLADIFTTYIEKSIFMIGSAKKRINLWFR